MSDGGPERPVALVLSSLSGQARARLIEALPQKGREQVLNELETVDGLDRASMPPVEQILAQELDRLFGDASGPVEAFREYYSLRVADVIALIVLKGSGDEAADVLVHLPHVVQSECVHAISARDWSALEHHLGADERRLIQVVDEWLGGPARRPRPDLAVSILQRITGARQVRALLTDIHHRDSEVAKAIQGALFSIEDLRRLSDRELQVLTTGIDDWDLATAMLGVSEGLRQRILSNVSERRAALLEEDVHYLKDADDDDIEAVCERILLRARMLYESGSLQTYLGSVSSETVDPDAGEPEEVEKKRKKGPVEAPVEEERPRSLRGVVLGVVGLSLILAAWFLGVGGGRGGAGRSRSPVSVSDFSRRQKSDEQGRQTSGMASREGKASQSSGLRASDGDVFVVSGRDRRSIEDAPIRHGDIVETGSDGRALISLRADDSQIELEPDSEMQVGEEGARPGPPRLDLRVGNIWVGVKNPALEVHSPLVSVTAATGALYRFRVVLSSATTISVEKGTAWVQSKVGDKDLIVVGAGKSARVYPRGSVEVDDLTENAKPRWLSFF